MRQAQESLVVIIGGGPAGLMAAEVLSQQGLQVDVYEAMPSVGRKFLMAGKGGMNITHAEPLPAFLDRYGSRKQQIKPLIEQFPPSAIVEWMQGLGVASFVGTSGRVFPRDMKAAPLLRAWLHRLRERGVRFHVRHRWLGWNDAGELKFSTPEGEIHIEADATVLAMGGGSWPQLGSDAAWEKVLREKGVDIAPLQPANCGFDVAWSEHFKAKFAGQPLKAVKASFTDAAGVVHQRQGDCVITENGLEGGLIYALSASLRNTITSVGMVELHLDLTPGRDLSRVKSDISYPRGSRSLSSHLQSRAGLKPVHLGLLHECLSKDAFADTVLLAQAIKSLPIKLISPRPLQEAISTAGGVKFEVLDESLMLKNLPGVFCAGEMLDWEAPTGGYLLSACFASGKVAGDAVLKYLKI